MKKTLTLILSIALCMAIAVPALAEMLDASHVCVIPEYTTDPVLGGAEWVSSSKCKLKYIHTGKCTGCNVVSTWYSDAGTPTDHEFVIYHSSCNGVTQTWNKRCIYCRDEYRTEYVTCPGGPHGGYCDLLPA